MRFRLYRPIEDCPGDDRCESAGAWKARRVAYLGRRGWPPSVFVFASGALEAINAPARPLSAGAEGVASASRMFYWLEVVAG